MTRLIDADAVIEDAFNLMDRNELLEDVPQIIKDYCDAQPTIEAVPVDFLKSISSRMYGKERFFRQTNGTWYDRKQADYISLEEMMDRIYQQIVELDDGIDLVPVRHGRWIKADSQQYFRKHYPCFTCSECGYRKDSQKEWNYCPNCGARMGEE